MSFRCAGDSHGEMPEGHHQKTHRQTHIDRTERGQTRNTLEGKTAETQEAEEVAQSTITMKDNSNRYKGPK